MHVIAWAAFLSLPIIFAPGPPRSLKDIFNPNAVRDYVVIFLMMLFFYINYFLLIPQLYFRKKHLYYVLLILIFFFITTILPPLLISYKIHRAPFLFETFHNIFVFLVVVFISFTLRINRQLKLAQKEKLNAELSYLKAQINPHFLFNTLNSIYSLSISKSEATPSAIVMLSGMMRYVISETNREFVALEKEINYISDYIELQKIRLGDTVKVEFTLEGTAERKQIAPLILIPFVENAFKHGVNPEEDSQIFITIHIHDSELQMLVHNNKVSNLRESTEPGGTGIKNVRKRLKILYSSHHTLLISDGVKQFSVNLRINLS
jgi:LytS/YehU family sensor histidine kinase